MKNEEERCNVQKTNEWRKNEEMTSMIDADDWWCSPLSSSQHLAVHCISKSGVLLNAAFTALQWHFAIEAIAMLYLLYSPALKRPLNPMFRLTDLIKPTLINFAVSRQGIQVANSSEVSVRKHSIGFFLVAVISCCSCAMIDQLSDGSFSHSGRWLQLGQSF